MSNMAGVLWEVGTACASWASGFTSRFLVGSVLLIVLVFCVVFFVLFVFILCLEYPMLPVSLDCPFLISRFSLTFMCNIDCLLNVPSRKRPSWILCWNKWRAVTADVTIVTDKVCKAGHERSIFILLYNNALTIMMYNMLIAISTIGLWHCSVCNFQNYDLY